MFGMNPIRKLEQGDGKTLRVSAEGLWYTLQGEGPYAGRPAIFIRLSGCHLACTFCDTQFDGPDDKDMRLDDILEAVNKLADIHVGREQMLVVVTGGEPMRQNIKPLCTELHLQGYKVQVETAGSFTIPNLNLWADIIVSPKTPMVHKDLQRFATAFKYVINADTQFENGIPCANTQGRGNLRKLGSPAYTSTPIYLSPMDEQDEERNAANRAAVARACLEFGYIAGLQMHKIFKVA